MEVQSREFEAYIDRITRGMEPEVLTRTLVTKAFDFIAGTVKLTPKDEGRAAGGWTPWTHHAGKPVGVTAAATSHRRR